jgi:hypothetical protein
MNSEVAGRAAFARGGPLKLNDSATHYPAVLIAPQLDQMRIFESLQYRVELPVRFCSLVVTDSPTNPKTNDPDNNVWQPVCLKAHARIVVPLTSRGLATADLAIFHSLTAIPTEKFSEAKRRPTLLHA